MDMAISRIVGMQILWYFQAWTKDSTKPITLWVEAKNQSAARNSIMRENPFITRLMFIRTKRIN